MSIAIKVENISKQYRLGIVGSSSLKDDIKSWWFGIRGKANPLLEVGEVNDRASKAQSEYVWALKDINFEVQKGDVLGIIGRNGAGKSTLLKILSKTTAPTAGSVKVNGRIASLLEVGTGFHPDLTGRENIYLNGAILGMRKQEITRKLDEIIDFAGVERYIDTPVKRYSSGMYVRLAFGVAAHLESEILIIDEVLAVGDGEFQKKCLGKIGQVSRGEGRTVLFVSHNMAAVKTLCTKGVVLQNGCNVFQGSQLEAVHYYQNSQNTNSRFKHEGTLETAPGNEIIRILNFEVKPLIGEIIQISSGFLFELIFYNYKENSNLDVTFELRTLDDIAIFHQGKIITSNKDSQIGIYRISGIIPADLINAGNYTFKLIFGENQRQALLVHEDIIQFEIMNEVIGSNTSTLPGIIRPKIDFKLEFTR